MTDTAIERSSLFTITGEPINLALAFPTPHHLRVTPPPNVQLNSGGFLDVLLAFTLAIIPNNFSPEQIRSLSDVENVGGKILVTHATNVQFTAGSPSN